MALSAIHDWLRLRGPFERGVELLKVHGTPSPAQLTLFAMPESPFSRAKLEEALRLVNERNQVPVPEIRSKKDSAPSIVAADDVDTRVHKRMLASKPGQDVPPELLPKDLRPLRMQLKQDFREFVYTRGTMRNTPDGMDLRAIAERVVGLRQKMRKGWWVIEHWHATGGLVATDKQMQVTNPVDLRRRERALSVWLSQRKPGAKNQRHANPGEMEAKRKELLQVRQLLKEHAVPA